MNNNEFFTAKMIAPCGLDCSLCVQAQLEVDPCPGCNGPDEPNKPEFCSKYCGIVNCEKRIRNGWEFCDVCPDFPCEDVMEKENRYTSQYPLHESPMENLKFIREKGMEEFLKIEKEHWACSNCGEPIAVRTGRCCRCGTVKV